MSARPLVCYGTRPKISAPISAPVCDGTVSSSKVSSSKVDLSHQPISKRTRNSYRSGGEFLILRGKYTEDYGDFGNSTYYTDGSDVRASPPSVKRGRKDAGPSTSDRKRSTRKRARGSKSRGLDGSIQTKPMPIIIEDTDTTGDHKTSVETDATMSRGMPRGVRKSIQTKPTTTKNTAATGGVHKSVQTESASPDNTAATKAAPRSPEQSTAISIDGYAFGVPADPVECYHKVRQEVIASYRAVVARRGTERDMALVLGSGTETRVEKAHGQVNGRGGSGRKRSAQGGKGGDLEEGKRVKRRCTEVGKRVKRGVAGEIDAVEGRGKGKGREESVML